jgi:hypothetical protein
MSRDMKKRKRGIEIDSDEELKQEMQMREADKK